MVKKKEENFTVDYDFLNGKPIITVKKISELIELREQLIFLLSNRSCYVDFSSPLVIRFYAAGKLWLTCDVRNLVLLSMYDDMNLYYMKDRLLQEEKQ